SVMMRVCVCVCASSIRCASPSSHQESRTLQDEALAHLILLATTDTHPRTHVHSHVNTYTHSLEHVHKHGHTDPFPHPFTPATLLSLMISCYQSLIVLCCPVSCVWSVY